MQDNIVYDPQKHEVCLTLSQRLGRAEIIGLGLLASASRTPFGTVVLLTATVALTGNRKPLSVNTFQDAAAARGLLARFGELTDIPVRITAHTRELPLALAHTLDCVDHGDLHLLLFEPKNAVVTAQWPRQEALPRICAELLALSPVCDTSQSDDPQNWYSFPPALAKDNFGKAAYFVVAHELLQAAAAPGNLGWERTWALAAPALACRTFSEALDALGGADISLICAVLAWRLLRERRKTGSLALPVPGQERLVASWEPVPERLLQMLYQITNLWLHFPAEEWGALGRTALAACSRLPLDLGASHIERGLPPAAGRVGVWPTVSRRSA
ncbi:MAG: hypothetical protein WCJ14_14715 [Verrucomicrobiota bacterium]